MTPSIVHEGPQNAGSSRSNPNAQGKERFSGTRQESRMNFGKSGDDFRPRLHWFGGNAETAFMIWVLKLGQTHIKVHGRRIVGRADFPEQAHFSRKHFELYETDDRLFILDLGSTNGTTVGGIRLKPNAPVELRSGDSILVGSTVLKVGQVESGGGTLERLNNVSLLTLDAGIFALLVAARLLLDPSTAYGAALGFYGLFIVVTLFFISLMLSSTLAKAILQPEEPAIGKARLYYVGAVVVASMAINFGLWAFVNKKWNAKDILSEARIEYFCMKHFNQNKCVVEVFRCPECAQQIDRWKRDLMVENLKRGEQQDAQKRKPSGARANP